MFSRRRQDCWHQTGTVAQRGPWFLEMQGLLTLGLSTLNSMAFLNSLSTLRGVGYPTPAQDSLPAAGQALPGGLSTRRVPTKGF